MSLCRDSYLSRMKEGKDTYHITYAGSYSRSTDITLCPKQTAEVLAYWLCSIGFSTRLLRENHDDTLPLQFKDPVKWRFSLWKTDLCTPNYRSLETHEGLGLRASAAWSLLDVFQQEYMCSACTVGFFFLFFFSKTAWEIKCVMGNWRDKPSPMHTRHVSTPLLL